MSDTKLRELLKFDDADLLENHAGRISENQIRGLHARRWERVYKTLILFLLLIVIAVAVFFFKFGDGTVKVKIPLAFWIIPSIVLALIIGTILSPLFKKMDLSLHSVQGAVKFVKVLDRRLDDLHHEYNEARRRNLYRTSLRYEMKIREKSFRVEEAFVDIMKQGGVYKIYYTGNEEIIAVESQ